MSDIHSQNVYSRVNSKATTHFSFNDTATTEIYTLSLHDALPISLGRRRERPPPPLPGPRKRPRRAGSGRDRKSTRLNSSHANISYAVFCLKKKIQHKRDDEGHKK